MISKFPNLQYKTKLKFSRSLSNFYDGMNYLRQSGSFHFEEYTFCKNAQGIAMFMHERMLSMKCLHRKPQIKSHNVTYYGLSYTIMLNFEEIEVS